MRGDERIHERFEVGAPPLRQRVADLPLVVDALAGELRADGREALVQPCFEAFDFVVFGAEVVARSACIQYNISTIYRLQKALKELMLVRNVQLEECVCDLQHQDVRVVVLVAD